MRVVMVDRVGAFYTVKGFFFKGKLISENETHYRIFEYQKQVEMDLLKSSIERVVWSEVS